MDIFLNNFYKIFIAILDILLLNFMLKKSYPKIYYEKFKKIKLFVYTFIFILLLQIQNTLNYTYIYLGIILLLFIIFSFQNTSKINLCIRIILYYILNIFIQILIIFLLSWLFNTRIFTFHLHKITTYTVLSHIISNYIIYIVLIIHFKENTKLYSKFFKFLSMCIFIYFSLTFSIKNPILFFLPDITRTYIFTVVISIVALICFDRMQAKYEAEKYSQEAIIQNMKKEKSFNEQRAKRQEEIKKINHNLVNILAIVQSHINDQEYEKAQDYLSETIQSVVEEYNALNHSGIDSLDGIIQEKMSIMKEEGIRYDEEISKLLHFGNIDLDNLGLIIDLALDKAIEEVKQISGEKYIRLTLQSKQTHIILHISHPIDKQHSRFHAHNQSSHHDLAFKQIETITKRYHGDIKYDTTDNEMILRVILEK